MVILARLVAKEKDTLGYITYVFECLDDQLINGSKYVMCTRYPNWDQKNISLFDEGYLHFEEVRAGIDKWYDGDKMNYYRYNGVQFLKFVFKPKEVNHEYVM